MTTRPRPSAAARRLAALAWPLLLLAGCVSAPSSPSGTASAAPVIAAAASDAAGVPKSIDEAAAQSVAAAAATASDDKVEAPAPVDPERPGVHINLDDRAARVDLWDRVRRGFAMPDIDNDLVRDRERWYATRPDYVARMTERGGRYLFYIVEELDKRGMPTELALLPFIESAYNPQAMSVARASGMWQFVPSTGRDYELKQNVFRDDRRDVLASTRAALDYLQKLYGMFGDWQLALAAYNWGEGSVQKAVLRNQKAGLPTDYASLRMPAETQWYLPKLQAVKNIIARPETFGLQLPQLLNHPYFLSVPIEHDMDVATAASIAGMPLEEFQTLNPQMNRPVILAAGTPQVLLPYDNANRFVRELPLHRGPLATWTAWTAPKTMKPDGSREVGGHERDPAARRQSDSGAHADQGRLDAAGAARQCVAGRRVEPHRGHRRAVVGARRAAAAQGVAACRTARHRRLGGATLSRQRRTGGAVEFDPRRRELRAGAERGGLSRAVRPQDHVDGDRERSGSQLEHARDGVCISRRTHDPARRQQPCGREAGLRRQGEQPRDTADSRRDELRSKPRRSVVSDGRRRRGRWFPGRRTRARCRSALLAPAA